MSGGVRLTVQGARATIALDRPEKLNALTVQDLSDFAAALGQVHAAPDVRVLVVTGAGDRAFSSGVSLADVDGGDWSDSPLTALCDGLEQFPLPTICALNGSAWGGAVEVALACDFRIGVEGMIARITPAALGICYDPGGVARIVRRLGPQAARRMLLAAETLDSAALLASGFLDRAVPHAAFAAEVDAMVERIAALAPLAVQGMKRTIVELGEGGLDAGAARERVAAAWASDDLREGLAAMREKRQPSFTGR